MMVLLLLAAAAASLIFAVAMTAGCGLVDRAEEGGKEVVREGGKEGRSLLREAARNQGLGSELESAVEEEGFWGALGRYWPELLLGQGGMIATGLALWMGLRRRRRKKRVVREESISED